jgi:hypothetical protein
MDPKLIQFWNEARLQLISFRAGFDPTQPTDAQINVLKNQLESTARQIDTNRRTSLYNLPSLYQDQMDATSSKTVYLATKWVKDGRPTVPTI